MQEVFSDKYQVIKYDQNTETIFFEIKNTIRELNEKEYLDKVFYVGIDILLKYKPKKILLDSRNFVYTLAQETEKTIQQVVINAYNKAGVKKLAILIPQDIFAQMAVLQIADIELDFQIKYFLFIEKAIKWLNN